MANIKKSFNFRNGVQVDDDNLKVSATGLVGIGTTVPTEALDVRGNAVISGVTSAVTLQAGVATITTLNPTEIIGAGVSIKSGIVTASSGIITYFGDGINLLNLPTSQWEDTIVGAGVSSIYNTGGNVGIATTAALFTLQVGNDANSGQKGVGISSFGDIKASGIVTATGFVGALTGDVTGRISGDVVGNINSTGVSTAADLKVTDLDVDGHTNLDNVTITGLTTFTNSTNVAGLRLRSFATNSGFVTGEMRVLESPSNTILQGGPMIQLMTNNTSAPLNGAGDREEINFFTTLYAGSFLQDGSLQLNKNFNVAGISTFTGNVIVGSGDLDVDGHTNLDNVSISGVTTSSGNINLPDNVNLQFGDSQDLKIYHGLVGGHSYIENTTGSLRLKNGGSTALEITNDGTTAVNNLTVTQGVNVTGIITATTELNSPLIGVGTDIPAHDIQVRKSGAAEIQVTSDTNSAGITVGREPSSGKTNNAEFRYGFSAGSDYNTAQSLDIINYGTDNFNYYLSANNPGAVTGNYFWHKGLNNVRLMTLTNTGRLGIGITAPTDELHVDGGATVSGNITVGNNVTVSGNIIGNVQGSLTGNVAGTLAGNTNTTVGISTLNNLSIAGIATAVRLRANKFAIGENPNLDLVSVFISNTDKVFVNDVGQVGIKTTIALTGVGINASSTNAVFSAIGVGVTQFTSAAVDLRDAGTATSRYMIPPKVSSTGGLQNLVSGAMVYNTSINKLQVYNGSAWETITSS